MEEEEEVVVGVVTASLKKYRVFTSPKLKDQSRTCVDTEDHVYILDSRFGFRVSFSGWRV